jgi:hypothetical protein
MAGKVVLVSQDEVKVEVTHGAALASALLFEVLENQDANEDIEIPLPKYVNEQEEGRVAGSVWLWVVADLVCSRAAVSRPPRSLFPRSVRAGVLKKVAEFMTYHEKKKLTEFAVPLTSSDMQKVLGEFDAKLLVSVVGVGVLPRPGAGLTLLTRPRRTCRASCCWT